MTVKAEFVISAKDRTREAIDGVQKRLESLDRTARMLRYAFTGYVFAEFARSVVESDIKLQSMRYTLEAATGSLAGAQKQMQFLFQTADKLGLSIQDVGQYYARMAAVATSSGYSLKKFNQEFVNISSGMRVLHLDARHTQYAWLALQEIMAQGTVKMRHLTRQLSIDFPTALQAMALGMHKSVAQLFQMVHDKALQGNVALAALSKGLKEMYGPQVQAASQGLQADLSRLGNKFTEAVNAADQSGKFQPFENALNALSSTLRDPGFIAAFGMFIGDLAKVANFSAKGFEAWMNGVDILAQKLNGLSTAGHGKSGRTLSSQLANAVEQAKKLRDLSEQPLSLKHHTSTQYQGHWYNLTQAQMTRWENLSAIIRNLRRIQAEGPSAVSRYNQLLSGQTEHHKAHHKHVVAFNTAQNDAIKSLGALDTSVTNKIDKQLTVLQRAQKILASIGPHTKGFNQSAYDAAKKQVQIIKEHFADLQKLNAEKEKQKKLTQQINAENRKHEQYVKSLEKDAEKWKNILDPQRKVALEVQRLNQEYQRGMITFAQYQAAEEKLTRHAHKALGSMNQFAVSAARNMQSAFATFLENPFKSGLRGMLESFSKTIEKMVAQWLAAQAIMKAASAMKGQSGWVGAIGSILGSLGGGKAFGGPVSAGTMYPVGENGPEMFVPSTNGAIIPNHALGHGHHTTINIDARGAGPDEVSKLLSMRKGLVDEIQKRIRYRDRFGHFPA